MLAIKHFIVKEHLRCNFIMTNLKLKYYKVVIILNKNNEMYTTYYTIMKYTKLNHDVHVS